MEVVEYEDDPQNPRFELPRIYKVSLSDPQPAAHSPQPLERRVHASRVIHVAEGLLENDVYGMPRLQRVYNLLDDILKLVGGSAEASWLLMRKGFVLNIDPDTELSTESAAQIEEEFAEYEHGLRRFMKIAASPSVTLAVKSLTRRTTWRHHQPDCRRHRHPTDASCLAANAAGAGLKSGCQ